MLVDRVAPLVERVKEHLSEISNQMADDETSALLAAEMNNGVLATGLAAQIPYSQSMAGEMFRGMISQVLEDDGNGGLQK